MVSMTYDEVLTVMVTAYNAYISPKSIKETNTNFTYLILKAVAKGYEIINNICVQLSNKFSPMYCLDEDLASTAILVGTDFLSGKGSSLSITVTNSDTVSHTLAVGTYSYAYNSDTSFSFTTTAATVLASGGTKTFIAVSSSVGSFEVTAQSSIAVTGEDSEGVSITIPSTLAFSCADNSGTQGYAAETPLEFRKRILSDPDRDSVIVELETKLKNLPRIYDATVTFNQTLENIISEGITIPPYYMLIALRGDVTDEVASVVAQYGVYPTVAGDGTVYYASDVFSGGQYGVNYILFKEKAYSIKLDFKYSTVYYSLDEIKASINSALTSYFNPVKRTAYITENIFYSIINALGLTSVVLLNVTLYDSTGTEVSYIEINKLSIAVLSSIVFNGTAV